MTDTFEFTLNNPLTEEQWDQIADVDFDRTNRIWFHTKHGKEVEFAKVIRCKDCKWYEFDEPHRCGFGGHGLRGKSDYCSDAERKEE